MHGSSGIRRNARERGCSGYENINGFRSHTNPARGSDEDVLRFQRMCSTQDDEEGTRMDGIIASTKATRCDASRKSVKKERTGMRIEIEPPAYDIVTEMLRDMGTPAHIGGFRYVREAVVMVNEDPMLINQLTTKLYPEIATKFGTTPSRVERAIRHSIEVTWRRGEPEVIERLRFRRGEKPKSGHFIASLVEEVRMQVRRG